MFRELVESEGEVVNGFWPQCQQAPHEPPAELRVCRLEEGTQIQGPGGIQEAEIAQQLPALLRPRPRPRPPHSSGGSAVPLHEPQEHGEHAPGEELHVRGVTLHGGGRPPPPPPPRRLGGRTAQPVHGAAAEAEERV